jgi:hypothetical protein
MKAAEWPQNICVCYLLKGVLHGSQCKSWASRLSPPSLTHSHHPAPPPLHRLQCIMLLHSYIDWMFQYFSFCKPPISSDRPTNIISLERVSEIMCVFLILVQGKEHLLTPLYPKIPVLTKWAVCGNTKAYQVVRWERCSMQVVQNADVWMCGMLKWRMGFVRVIPHVIGREWMIDVLLPRQKVLPKIGPPCKNPKLSCRPS